MATVDKARITFNYSADVEPAQGIRLVGDCLEMGNWDPLKGVDLFFNEDNGQWKCSLELLLNSTVEYKYLEGRNEKWSWEELPGPGNRKLEVSNSTAVVEDRRGTVKSSYTPQDAEAPNTETHYYDASIDDNITYDENDTVMIISLRLPIRVSKSSTGEWEFSRDVRPWSNPLYEFVKSANSKIRWLGWPWINVEDPTEQEDLRERLKEYNCIPVFLNTEDMEGHNEFCRDILFPFFHNSLDGFIEYDLELWEKYRNVNSVFASHVIKHQIQGEMLWIHDYQMLLVPSLLIRRIQGLNIGFAFHVPFPSFDVFRVLPHREHIIYSILCCDLITFHQFDYCRHFITICKRMLGVTTESSRGFIMLTYEGRQIITKVQQFGIDFGQIKDITAKDAYKETVAKLQQQYSGKQVLLGIDPFNKLAGIPLKLNAIRQLLTDKPRLRQNFIFVQFLEYVPVLGVQEQDELWKEIDSLRTIINKEAANREVVRIEVRELTHLDRCAWLSVCDSLILSRIRSSLVLLPFEFISIRGTKPGSIVVSEFSGISTELLSINRVNPFDLTALCETIERVLTWDDPEIPVLRQQDIAFIQSHTSSSWAQSFLTDLKRNQKDTANYNYVVSGGNDKLKLVKLKKDFAKLEATSRFLSSYTSACNRVIILDSNGTIIDLNERYRLQDTVAVQNMKVTLECLCRDERNTVVILTGRDRFNLEKHYGDIPGLSLAAEYGVQIRWAGRVHWENYTNTSHAWTTMAIQIIEQYVKRTPGSEMHVKENSVVFQFSKADPDFGNIQAKELAPHLESLLSFAADECQITSGIGYIEVTPRGVNKGNTLRDILEKVSKNRGLVDFVLAIGDDKSDEEMFKMIQVIQGEPSRFRKILESQAELYACTVGLKPSAASYYILSVHDTILLLDSLSTCSSRRKMSFSSEDLVGLTRNEQVPRISEQQVLAPTRSKTDRFGSQRRIEEASEDFPSRSPSKKFSNRWEDSKNQDQD